MNKKRAFSLVEVLLVMGIIAVVVTLGLSVAKKGMEKAYNQYWYTVYQALLDGTNDAIIRYPNILNNPNSMKIYTEHLAGLFKLDPNDFHEYIGYAGRYYLTLKNGVFLDIYRSNNTSSNEYWLIRVNIPHATTRNNSGTGQSVFAFDRRDTNTALGPRIYPADATAWGSLSQNDTNLQDRVDILPFYINEGNPGPITEFYSFRQAYCMVYGPKTFPNVHGTEIPIIDCTGIAQSKPNGIIFPINPRKIY